ncbi:hypothetical protein BKP37_01630 [Anaerobacillus alkalilacustris]|uniref:Lipoprotein n=1 Tax=Anaerobacillus alkalilacustris TaxID=393763 RepID=A0A1S2LXJ6_9BACI|nr:hypothetical protein [Anaerobacillus alkalilacustris]OIJ17231.1 hypothetical protein BKP37_01630 [Anaerobacillus alkalilacustris]
MVKRLIGIFMLLALLSSCGNGVEEEKYYFYAESEHWKAVMNLTLPPPPEQNFTINLDFMYMGPEANIKPKIMYHHILEWYSHKPTVVSDTDFIPTLENPYQLTLYDTRVIGGYNIGQKWVTQINWYDSGRVMVEDLVFEEKK